MKTESVLGTSISSTTDDLSGLLSQAQEAVCHLDKDWVVRYCNDIYLQNLRLPREQVVGHTPFEYIPNFTRSIFYAPILRCKNERRPVAAIGFSPALNRWILTRLFPSADGGGIMLLNDASETIVEQYQLAQHALKDTLTGLPNKLALTQSLQGFLAAKTPFSLAVLGLNRFKTVNDTLGFAKGDRFLMKMASCLQSATVEGEQLFRLAGDEFVVLSRRPALDLSYRVQTLIAQASRPIRMGGQSFVLGACAGVVLSGSANDEVELLLRRAALALGRAKQSGRSDFLMYEDSMEVAVRTRVELEAELRQAVVSGAFALLLQPKGSLAQRNVRGAEALIRWPHKTRGMVSPGEFLPLAQECGLMVEIDKWVLGRALEYIATLQQSGNPTPISINLSVESLGDPGLAENVRQALKKAKVEPHLLEIEIPEGALMRDVKISGRVLDELHAMGVLISIDDFGTGYSSFAYLARFPIDTLKIDRSFVNEMGANEASRKIVKGLVHLAHSLNMRVVAEGAETEDQMAVLTRLHCDEVQGFGYGRPMPYNQFSEFVRMRNSKPAISAFTI